MDNLVSANDECVRRGALTQRPGTTRKLDADETLELSARCATARTDDEFEAVLDDYLYLRTGSNKGARALALDARFRRAVSEGVYFVFANGTPEYEETQEAKDFLKRYVGSRFVSVRLLRAGYAAYLRAKEKGEIQSEPEEKPAPLSNDEQNLRLANDMAREIVKTSFSGM